MAVKKYTEYEDECNKRLQIIKEQKEDNRKLIEKYEQANADKKENEALLSSAKGQISNLTKSIEKKNNHIYSLEQKIFVLEQDRTDSWQKYKTEKIQKLETDLSSIKLEIGSLYEEYSNLEKKKSELTAELSTIEALRAEYAELTEKNDTLKELIQISEDKFHSLQTQSENQNSANSYNKAENMSAIDFSHIIFGTDIDLDPEQVKQQDLAEYLKDNLNEAGISNENLSSVSAYLLSAYSLNNPLIIAGYGSIAMLDALSATIKNKTTHRFYYNGNPSSVSEFDEGSIIAVYDGLSAIDKILDRTGNRYVCFISTTSEELQIEPKSIFNYALPLFTEYFIFAKSSGEYLGSLCESQPKYAPDKKIKSMEILKYLSSLSYTNLCDSISTAKHINANISEYSIFLLTTMPILLSLSKRNELLEIIQKQNFSDGEKQHLHYLIGEIE
jgi:hypothetical protein